MPNFNSRPSARGDVRRNLRKRHSTSFQFTPLREGRRAFALYLLDGLHFNSRPSARGDPNFFERRKSMENFNSRPSARGDSPVMAQMRAFRISIHAPPRGATPPEARRVSASLFQFTPLREGRHEEVSRERRNQISIHAPPRGATRIARYCCAKLKEFQFTPLREGRRAKRDGEKKEHIVFQFTPLREGRRDITKQYPQTIAISIHAPPRGATASHPRDTVRKRYFNSRPSARGDDTLEMAVGRLKHFNSRPSARGDTNT